MIRQEAAGIYAWLPLGFRVLQKIEQIVREEMDRAGAIEMLMPTLQPADLWRETGRYDDYGEEMLRIKDRHERELLYGPTNEDMITEIFRAYVKSYKDAAAESLSHPVEIPRRGPPALRRHARPRVPDEGRLLLRHRRGGARKRSYNRMFVAYLRTFARMGLKAIPMRAETGPIGGDLCHEFIVLADTGESEVFCHKDLLDMPVPGQDIDFDGDLEPIVRQRTELYAATDGYARRGALREPKCPTDKRITARGIEVGQIFYFGTKYSEPMKATGHRPGRQGRPDPWRLLRRRRLAPGRRDHRGQPRRRRHHLAGAGRAVRGRADQSEGRRRRRPMRPARTSTRS